VIILSEDSEDEITLNHWKLFCRACICRSTVLRQADVRSRDVIIIIHASFHCLKVTQRHHWWVTSLSLRLSPCLVPLYRKST